MPIFRISVRDVRRDVADLLAVGSRVAHALLRLPHLRGGDHFHRLGDLARVLHAADLQPDFLGAGNQKLAFFFQSLMASCSAFSSSSERSFFSSMRPTRLANLPFRWSLMDFS